MPIRIPDQLPAASVLAEEQIFVMSEERATHQDIRPLELLILNLMPLKIITESQYLRKLSNTPLQVNITLLRIDDHESRHTPKSHLDAFYRGFQEVRDRRYDGMIVTGAALDRMPFEEVRYWDRLNEILHWSASHVTSTLFSCWAASAALQVFYDLPRQERERKLSGVFRQDLRHGTDPLVRGFDDHFLAPHSRYVDFPVARIEEETDLSILADGPETGVYLAVSPSRRQVYVTGHPEYDADTLAQEYRRDLGAGGRPTLPENYFPYDDPSFSPSCVWRSHASILFSNWLNYYVYQATAYDLSEIGRE
ncbi:MAG: homoserine O-succinyltransferase [Succinivibrionaceae bacterium]|nr:homoserine O-succinyltransferase [Succinivibrionaceae bacterium]